MKKEWLTAKKISKLFYTAHNSLNSIALQLLWNRGMINDEEITEFLGDSESGEIFDPFLFKEMEEAVELIIRYIKNKDKIIIYGDYDADGVTAATLLFEVFSIFKADVEVYIPDRKNEGYGFNKNAIEKFSSYGVKLIISVDSGIRNYKEVKIAKDKGIDVIITDHHQPADNPDHIPDCIIINPLTKNENYPYKKLAGVGVAYKLASALISRSKLNLDQKRLLENNSLDLVAIGTVADCVSLLGENRVLVKLGLKILQRNKRLGIAELLKIAKIDSEKLKSWNIGFQIAPRINSAGRMAHATTALELLSTKDRAKAQSLAKRLQSRNLDRQQATSEIITAIEKEIEVDKKTKIIITRFSGKDKKDSWNEGVVGLVAGRLADKYYRPVLIMTKGGPGLKGSGRSISEFNLIKAIEKAGEFLEKFGGHPAACGFSLKEENFSAFKNAMINIANKELKDHKFIPKINIEAEVDFNEIDLDLAKEITKFEPFGEENPQPIFATYKLNVVDIYHMGLNNQHVKFKLAGTGSKLVTAIGFNQSEQWQGIKLGAIIDVAYYLDINEFNGRQETQLKIVDIKIHQEK